ncbi:CheY-like chemotaxis protein [Constrictibacter sp. MBR-5]
MHLCHLHRGAHPAPTPFEPCLSDYVVDSESLREAGGRSPQTVLVVDDNATCAKLFQTLLVEVGYRVVLARTGAEALDVAHVHLPHLIHLDCQLPKVSGYEVATWLNQDEALRTIPVVMVTCFEFDLEELRDAIGVVDYMRKPVVIGAYRAMVRRHIRQG